MHLMALGQFLFSLSTLSFDDFKRQSSWRHPSNSRVGARPASQSLGPGDDTIGLSGLLVPEFAGSRSYLRQLRDMADSGKAFALVSGAGEAFGAYVIENINETGTVHTGLGVPRRTEFDLQLKRVDDIKAEPGGGVDPGPVDDYWEWWL